MIIFADRQAHNQADTNSKTEAHSYPLWIVGERANLYHIQSELPRILNSIGWKVF